MKALPRIVVFLLCFGLIATAGAAQPEKAAKSGGTPGTELAALASQVTGIAISPLLGVSAVGAYQYFKAGTPAQKAGLPWFAHPLVWSCGLLIVGVCAFKDAFGTVVPPGLKKPLDVLELAENKLSGLVATGAVVPVLVSMATRYLGSHGSADISAAPWTGLAMIQWGMIDVSWLLNILMVPLAIAMFAVVWVVSHAINVLILLSPWGAVDAALKAARTAVLGIVTATAFIDPVVGATLSLAIVITAYFCAGWAFRLMIFGSVFTWDFLTFRRHRFAPAPDANWVFTAQRVGDVPIRTYGRLLRPGAGPLELAYRPWLVRSERRTALPADGLAVGCGMLWPTVEYRASAGQDRTLLTLPPRYCGHERAVADTYAIRELRDVGLRRGWALVKELFRGSAPAAVPALPSPSP